MSCEKSKEKILIFDQLSEHGQNQLLEHIETCSECQTYFDCYLDIEEGLDILLQDVEIHPTLIRKKANHRIFKRSLLTCASVFLLMVAAWNTPPVKAAIEKALNEVLIDYFQGSEQPLDPEENNKSTEKIIYSEQVFPNGRTLYVYSSGQKTRTEFDNGDFNISDGNYLATYSKKDNLFFIQELEHERENILVETFKDIDPNSITYKGDKKYLDRRAEVYLVEITEDLQREYWFDKDTHLFIKEVEIYKGERQDNDSNSQFKIIEIKKNHRLFDFIAPEGARIVDESTQVAP